MSRLHAALRSGLVALATAFLSVPAAAEDDGLTLASTTLEQEPASDEELDATSDAEPLDTPELPPEADAAPPRVDLRRVRREPSGYSAPLVGATGRAALTLDPYLQVRAERLLARARPSAGAVVLVDVPSGRVLVWAELADKPGGMLLDGRAASASVFKVVTSAALLENARLSPGRNVCALDAAHSIERRHLDAPAPGTAGVACHPFRTALGFSRNAVFAQLATAHLGRAELAAVATRFGFNAPVPFVGAPVPFGELRLPAPDLAFARAAAGFQGSWLSPLGALELGLVIANGGAVKELTIIESAPGYRAPSLAPRVRTVMKRRTALNVARMMELTVHGGTSLEAFTAPNGESYLGRVRVGGKTGTLGGGRGETTSWFIGFAPARAPRIAVAVLLANGHVWHAKANAVARDVLRTWFAREPRTNVTDPFATPVEATRSARPLRTARR